MRVALPNKVLYCSVLNFFTDKQCVFGDHTFFVASNNITISHENFPVLHIQEKTLDKELAHGEGKTRTEW